MSVIVPPFGCTERPIAEQPEKLTFICCYFTVRVEPIPTHRNCPVSTRKVRVPGTTIHYTLAKVCEFGLFSGKDGGVVSVGTRRARGRK